jgi:FGGY-family pentulose kinase
MGARDSVVMGVDVGTGSVRAGVFTLDGRMLGTATSAIREGNPKADFYEQSSQNIWEETGKVVREALRESGKGPGDVAGLSFDATCSLVVLDKQGKPLTISESGDPDWNVIVWRDHRAIDQVDRINAGGHNVLQYVGGVMSPEQEPPKLMWLKEHLPETWAEAGKFLDLADYMVYEATGEDVRSLCTNVCKWAYLGHESRWDKDFYAAIGLEDLFEDGKVTDNVAPMGEHAGNLSGAAAEHLGPTTDTAVSVGIIDAHAGGIGVGVDTSTLALIGGTSSCHMAVAEGSRFVGGVWGPYFSAMIPEFWLNEGGQSATGALLDHTIERFGTIREGDRLRHVLDDQDINSVYSELNAFIANKDVGPEWTRDVHILPYFHGNRSPNADPNARGIIDGLSLDMSYETLALMYHATIHAVAYGTRHIIDAMEAEGYRIEQINACGGGTKNALWIQEHADATQRPVRLPREPEAVLLGSAILGAVAAGIYPSIPEAMKAMCHAGEVVEPNAETKGYHDWKYGKQLEMYGQQIERRKS